MYINVKKYISYSVIVILPFAAPMYAAKSHLSCNIFLLESTGTGVPVLLKGTGSYYLLTVATILIMGSTWEDITWCLLEDILYV